MRNWTTWFQSNFVSPVLLFHFMKKIVEEWGGVGLFFLLQFLSRPVLSYTPGDRGCFQKSGPHWLVPTGDRSVHSKGGNMITRTLNGGGGGGGGGVHGYRCDDLRLWSTWQTGRQWFTPPPVHFVDGIGWTKVALFGQILMGKRGRLFRDRLLAPVPVFFLNKKET